MDQLQRCNSLHLTADDQLNSQIVTVEPKIYIRWLTLQGKVVNRLIATLQAYQLVVVQNLVTV